MLANVSQALNFKQTTEAKSHLKERQDSYSTKQQQRSTVIIEAKAKASLMADPSMTIHC